jgi:cysteine-rich repeat protein
MDVTCPPGSSASSSERINAMHSTALKTLPLIALITTGCAAEEIQDIIDQKGVTYCSMGHDGGGDDAPADTSSTAAPEPCGPDTTSTSTTSTSGTTGSGESSSAGDDTSSGTTAGAPVCGDGVVEGEETCDDMNSEPDDGCNNVCARDSLIFVTSQVYPGDVKGLAGADQRCRMLAALAGLPRFDTFRAWLSTAESPAADRLLHSRGRYVLVNTLVVAEDWDGLVSGTLLHPINVDEMSQTQSGRFWTGTLFTGQPAFGSDFCDGWTTFSGDLTGGTGLVPAVDPSWSFFSEGPCDSDAHLICVEQ